MLPKRDGVPQISRPILREGFNRDELAKLGTIESPVRRSDLVRSAEDLVAITRSTLEKQKIDRELEENEDWFRDRERQRAVAEEVERQGARAPFASRASTSQLDAEIPNAYDSSRRRWIAQP